MEKYNKVVYIFLLKYLLIILIIKLFVCSFNYNINNMMLPNSLFLLLVEKRSVFNYRTSLWNNLEDY